MERPAGGHQDSDQSGCSVSFEPGGTTLPAASKNQAKKTYHDELPVRPGIGSEIGMAARIPSIARHPAITNKAIFGARNISWPFPKIEPTIVLGDGKGFLYADRSEARPTSLFLIS